jgi:hypothetical protein
MSVNIEQLPVWKHVAGKMRSLGLGMALLPVVFMAGCGGTAKPTLTSIAPSSGIQGAAVAVTLTGTNFGPGSTISLSGTGINVSSPAVVSSTSITATFTIAASAPTGPQNVTVTTGSKTSGSQTFTVNSGAPTLTSIAPSSGVQGTAVAVTVTGTLFASGSTIALSGTGITVSNITVVSSTSITATFTIALNAPAGAQNVTVTTAIGTSGTQPFTVNALPPTVTFTNPANLATGIPLNRKIAATLSKPMDSTTITAATFTLVGGGTNVAGTVTYNATSNVATFAPMANLAANTTFTATITTGAKDLSGTSLALSFAWTFTTGATADSTAPTVISTAPASGATAVALNQKIAATFSKVMDSSTITTTTFTLKQGTTAVAGTLSYAGATATFTPTANLAASTLYTATITTGAADLAGNALASNFVWTFTTGTATNTSAPTVTSTVPLNAATGVGINQTISATFSTGMDPATISTITFTLAGPGTTSVIGTVTCNAGCTIATFTPTANLTASALFTATITTGAKDLSGNALATNKVWTFTTGATATGPGPVNLGSASTLGDMGGGAGMTNQGINTVVNGDIGTTGASTTVTGFHDTAGCTYTETPSNMGLVNGKIYTAPPPPTGGPAACATTEGTATTFAIAQKALADAQTAFNTLKGMPGGPDPGAGQLGGLTLAPGVYTSASGSFLITGSDLTLDAKGDANAVWVFQMASTLTVGAAAAPRSVILINGAQAKNVFWQVSSAATINGAGGGTMVGTIIASAGVTFSTAGNVAITTLNGRALGLNASVTLVNTVINVPLP